MADAKPAAAAKSPSKGPRLSGPEHDDVRARIERGEIASGRGVRWIGVDLSGLDLSGWDLEGAELSRSKLVGTRLIGAKLLGATLFEADLTDADFSNADLTEANMEGARALRTAFGAAKLVRTRLGLADLTGASWVGVNAEGASLTGACLERARLGQANLKGADLTRCSLREAELSSVQVFGTTFAGADLRGAKLPGISGFRKADWLGVDLRDVDFSGAYLCRNVILDQNYLEDFRTSSKFNAVVYQLWKATSDCGRSALRWAVCTGVATVLFAILYAFVGVDFGENATPLSPLYFSVVTITTLGYGDVLPVTQTAQMVVMAQVMVGYIMLGGLISLCASKMATRAA